MNLSAIYGTSIPTMDATKLDELSFCPIDLFNEAVHLHEEAETVPDVVCQQLESHHVAQSPFLMSDSMYIIYSHFHSNNHFQFMIAGAHYPLS